MGKNHDGSYNILYAFENACVYVRCVMFDADDENDTPRPRDYFRTLSDFGV